MPEIVADYAGFDFRALWRRRGRVTEIEEALLRSLLGPERNQRVLEIGTGFGRLTPTIRALSQQYVGTDFDPSALEQSRARIGGERDPETRWVVSNVHHLPFVAGSFSTVVLVRVAHHLPHWEAAARSLAHLLRPGGRCIVTVVPSPSIGTVVQDVKQALGGVPGSPRSTWVRGEDVQVAVSPHPIFTGSRRGYRESLGRVGLRITARLGSGLEEFLPGIPARAWVGLAPTAEPWPWFPTKWYAAAKEGVPGGPLPPLDSILACPRCATPLPPLQPRDGGFGRCGTCGFEIQGVAGMPDLRFLGGGAIRIGPGVPQSAVG
jgi:SAM-dependent methyltransferase